MNKTISNSNEEQNSASGISSLENELPDMHPAILVVEDDDAVRTFLCDVLMMHHYKVVEASNAEDALETFHRNYHSIGLVVLDIQLPRMGGLELSHKIRELFADTPLLFISGFWTESNLGGLDERTGFLAKPFTANVFVQKIQELLERNALRHKTFSGV